MAETPHTVPSRLHHWATRQPDTAAFIFVDNAMRRRVLTRADVYRLAARFAAILQRDDVRRGDVVCNTVTNSPERVVSDFGIMMAGATVMNGQIFLAEGADFLGSLKDGQCKAVILDPLQPKGAASLLASLKKEELSDGTLRFHEFPALRRIVPCCWKGQGEVSSFLDMLEQQEDSYVAEVTADDLAYIWTTSGSTGFSKLVPHSHSDVLEIAFRFATGCGLFGDPDSYDNAERAELETDRLKSRPSPNDGSVNVAKSDAVTSHQFASFKSSKEDTEAERGVSVTHYAKNVFFSNGRLAWSAGFPSCYLTVGATRVLLDLSHGPPSDPAALVWAVIRQERCNFGFMLPYHLQQILYQENLWSKLPWKFNVLPLGGQPVHASLVKSAMGKVTSTMHVIYGSTEFGVITSQTVHDPDQYKDCSNGKPVTGMEVRLIDTDEEKVTSATTSRKMGEITVCMNIKFRGYVNNEEATKKMTLPDGWFRTGDVGYFNDKGDLCVVCRSSFMIMRGAFLLHPGWLEARISTHPGVETVMVVPVPDPVLHQELCACVVPKPKASLTAEELREFCQTLFLTDSTDHMTAVPPYFLFFSALPTTATGKPCRQTTTKEARQRLGL
ncbi:hypothetical protein ACOMHN_041612 [Nucella lapillus]